MNINSLLQILKNNNDNLDLTSRRLKKRIKEIKQDKLKINKIATQYNEFYRQEIENGTKQKQLLLSEGKLNNLTENEAERRIVKEHGFIPTIHTPILNWLYFFMNEHKNNTHEIDRKILNKKIGHMTHDEIKVMENTPDLFEFLYGNITLSLFSKLKKLKALSRSKNKYEAFNAYSKCISLCEQHNIDFDKIPIK